MEAVIVVLLIGLLAALGVGVWLLLQGQRRPAADPDAQRLEQQLAAMRAELAQAMTGTQQAVGEAQRTLLQQMNDVDTRVGKRLETVQSTVDKRLEAVDNRVGHSMNAAQETIGQIGKQLGALGESAQRILEVGQHVSSLRDILQPPKIRGNFGERLLEQLVAQVLPSARYSVQYKFSDGSIADMVIHIPEGDVPIDAKFPIDSFRRMIEAPTEEEQARQRRAFLRDVRTRIDQVAKYIRPDDHTLDFALMYVPAENIYYEAIAGTDEDSCMTYALERRVHLVSPNTFHAFLLVIARGFQRLEVERNAEEIVARLGQLRNEFSKFRQEFEVLGGHVGRAKNKYDELDKLAGRFGDRLEIPVQARLELDARQPSLPEPREVPAQVTLPKPAGVNGNDDPI